MNLSMTARMRELLAGDKVIVAPCAYDALSAKLIEDAGFVAAGTTGYGMHGAMLGTPDNGLLAFNEMVEACGKMVDAVNIPIMADAEGGYGNAINTMRTIRSFEKAGLAGLFIEDQKLPPNCPLLKETRLISVDEMVGKIKAAVDARTDPNFVIVARTDAPFEEACERGNIYREAGADMVKPICKSYRDLVEFPKRINAPLHMGFGSKDFFDDLTVWDLGEMGYKIVTFPMFALFARAKAERTLLHELKRVGTLKDLQHQIMPLNEYFTFIGKEKFKALDEKYLRD